MQLIVYSCNVIKYGYTPQEHKYLHQNNQKQLIPFMFVYIKGNIGIRLLYEKVVK